MGTSSDQRKRRKDRIGSSDSPAIVGVNPPKWTNAYDVYLEKTADVRELAPKEAIEIGNDFEAPLLAWASRQLGVEIVADCERESKDDPIMAANHDALVVTRPQGLEAKTGTGADYGDPETDQVPERVIVQCQHQMYVSELELVWVPVLIAKFDRLERTMYKVTRNEKLIEVIRERDHAFWENNVLPRIPPADLLPSLGVLRRVRRIPETLAAVDPALVTAWKEAHAAYKAAETAKEEAVAALVASMGDAAGADFGDPRKVLTYRGYTYDQIDGKKLKLALPDVWKEFSKTIDVSPSLKEVNR